MYSNRKKKFHLFLFFLGTQIKIKFVFSFYSEFLVTVPVFLSQESWGKEVGRIPQVMVNEELNSSRINYIDSTTQSDLSKALHGHI